MLSALDLSLLFGYLVLSLGVGFLSARAPHGRASVVNRPNAPLLVSRDSSSGSGRRSSSRGATACEGNEVANQFLLNGRASSPIVVGISLLSGLLSGISYLGVVGYSYMHGVAIVATCLSQGLGAIFVGRVLAPFYSHLGLPTGYAYLEFRFSRSVRNAAAVLFVLRVVAYLAVVLLAPARMIDSLCGLPAYACVLVTGVAATLYTMKGGMRAVIVTDCMQSVTLSACALLVLLLGLTKASIGRADWRLSGDDLLIKSISADNVWFMVVGGTVSYIAQAGTDQIAIQRILSTPSLEEMRRSSYLGGGLNSAVVAILGVIGVALHAFYRERHFDPVAAGVAGGGVASSDDIMPFFVLHDCPDGVIGLLGGAVLGCTLSVFSGGLNAASTSCAVDILQNACGAQGLSQHRLVRATQAFTLGLGVLVTALSVGASMLVGVGVVQFSLIIVGLLSGPTLGLFLAGIFTRRANAPGVLCGLALGLTLVLYISLGKFGCAATASGNATLLPHAACAGPLAPAYLVNDFSLTVFVSGTTSLVGVLASLGWPPPKLDATAKLTYWGQSAGPGG
jgi:SSS family solute:Na+ symporter